MASQVVFMSDADNSKREHLHTMARDYRLMGHTTDASAIEWALEEVERVRMLYQEHDASVVRERGHLRQMIDDLTAQLAKARRERSVGQ